MRTVKQLSVSNVHKPGRLSAVLEALRKEKVDILAMCVMGEGGRHSLRFVPEDPALALSALETIGVPQDTAEVLLVELTSQNGTYPHLCERLAASHLEMDYSYSAFKAGKGGGVAVVKVNNLTKAQRVLGESASNGAKKKQPRRRPMQAR